MKLYRANRTFIYDDSDGNESIKTWIFEGQCFYVTRKDDLPGYGILNYIEFFDEIKLDFLLKQCND